MLSAKEEYWCMYQDLPSGHRRHNWSSYSNLTCRSTLASDNLVRGEINRTLSYTQLVRRVSFYYYTSFIRIMLTDSHACVDIIRVRAHRGCESRWFAWLTESTDRKKYLCMSFSTNFRAGLKMSLTIGSVSIQRKTVPWLTRECSQYTSWYCRHLEWVKEPARTNPNSLCEIELDDHFSDVLYMSDQRLVIEFFIVFDLLILVPSSMVSS